MKTFGRQLSWRVECAPPILRPDTVQKEVDEVM